MYSFAVMIACVQIFADPRRLSDDDSQGRVGKMDYDAEQAQELEILESIYTEEEFESPVRTPYPVLTPRTLAN
jgi:hypothetical protein